MKLVEIAVIRPIRASPEVNQAQPPIIKVLMTNQLQVLRIVGLCFILMKYGVEF